MIVCDISTPSLSSFNLLVKKKLEFKAKQNTISDFFFLNNNNLLLLWLCWLKGII